MNWYHIFMNKSPTQNMLITGAALRIGREIALHFAAAGWNIAIHYRRSDEAAKILAAECGAIGVKTTLVQADFSNDFDADALFDTIARDIGAVNVLINNASSFNKDTLSTATHEQFHQHMQVNLYAPIKMIQSYANHVKMHQLTDCSIINLGDGTRGWSLSSKFLSYSLSKLGLMQLSELLAIELAPAIRINAIGLGPSLAGEVDDANMFDRLKQRSPLKQNSSPQEVCQTINYLLATPTITGQSILLNGGLHCHQAIDISST